jgi:hypothetical protein
MRRRQTVNCLSISRWAFFAGASGFIVSSCQQQPGPIDETFVAKSAASIRTTEDANRELRPLKRRALTGDSRAAGTLSQIYDRCASRWHIPEETTHSPVETECLEQARLWDNIAAENGSPAAAASKAQTLMAQGTCEDVYRARYWLSKTLEWNSGTPWKEMSRRLARMEKQCGW